MCEISCLLPRLHDTAGCQTGCTIQPVWQTGCLFTRYSRLSNRVVQPVWQPCWTNSHCSLNWLSHRVVQPVWQPAVYTIQPVFKPVVKRVWQLVECLYTRYSWFVQVVSCKRGLYVYIHLQLCNMLMACYEAHHHQSIIYLLKQQ